MSRGVGFRQSEQTQQADEARFNDALCQQLAAAYRTAKRNAYASAKTVDGAHLLDLSVASFTGNTPCTHDVCTATSFLLRVYRLEASDDAQFRSLHAMPGMFVSHGGVEYGVSAGIIAGTRASNARLLLHVCTRFCAGYASSHLDQLHSDELRSEALRATTVYFCNVHARFHICDRLCAYQDTTSKEATSICALSRIVISIDNSQFSFGDGTGSRERAERSEQNADHGADASSGGGAGGGGGGGGGNGGAAKRKRTAANRIGIRSSSAAVKKRGMTTEHLAATQEAEAAKTRQQRTVSAAKRKKASKIRGANKPSLIDLEPLVVFLEPKDVQYLTAARGGGCITNAEVTLNRKAPFEYRRNGAFDREYALDELRGMHQRERLTKQFMLGRSVHQNTFFTDEDLLCRHLVLAYELVEYMLFGEQVNAIARQSYERSHTVARKTVQQYITTCRKDQTVIAFDMLEQIYVEALPNAHVYVGVVIDESLRRTALTYYALLVVEFYFGLLALEVDVPPEDTHAAYATVRAEFSFAYFVPVIVDMMHSSNYVLDGVCVLPRDTFLIGEYCPDSGVMRQIGLSEHMANTLKTLLKQLIEIARRKSSMRTLQATQLSWADLAQVARTSSYEHSSRHTIQLFLEARARRIADMTRVVAPLDNPHPAVIDLTEECGENQ